MSSCSAVCCSNRGAKGFLMKSFPRDPKRRALWASQIKRDDWQPNDHSRLCEIHFDDDQWEKTREDGTRKLKCSAVPTLFNHFRRMPRVKRVRNCKFVVHSKENNAGAFVLLEERDSEPSLFLGNIDLRGNEEISHNQNPENEVLSTKDNCCRVCAARNDKSCIPIFGDSDLAEKISRCLPIIVLPNDNLPLQICQRCLRSLDISYKLIMASLETDVILRTELSNQENLLYHRKSDEFRKPESVRREEPIFKINGPIRCDLCNDFFQDMYEFDEHMESIHLLKWRCCFCDNSFESSQELVTHKTLRHYGLIVTCEGCAEADNSAGDYQGGGEPRADTNSDENSVQDDHETDKEVPELNCTKCKIAFGDSKQFKKHHTIHSPRRIRCSVCFKRCSSIFEHLMHFRIAHNRTKSSSLSRMNAIHDCKYCRKVFLNKQRLIVHLRKHKKEMFDDPSVTIYNCVTCPKKFVDRTLYQKHRNVHDPACWHKFRCYICNRSFMDKFKLKIHQSIHDGVKPYRCDVCDREFNRNANMIRHRAKHFEQTCRHCDNSFINSKSLREHLKDIHGDTLNPKNNSRGLRSDANRSNVRRDNFVCRYCGKQLTSYYSLLDHERIHTGDKPYVCERCGKAFRSLAARWDHMVRHEEVNYVCELCGKTMSNKLNLRRHLRKHAAIEQRRFECNECGKLFHVRWRLNAHLVRIHHSPPNS